MTQEEKEKTIQKIWSHVDYAVGDWVETCNMMPGIVQSIDIGFDEKQNCFHETVEIFYPHYALNPNKHYPYKGKSCCSVTHCGVHKITPEYACKLMSIGEEKLIELWRDFEILVKVEKKDAHWEELVRWKELVEEYYNKL